MILLPLTSVFKYIFSYVEFESEKGFFERFLNLCARKKIKVYSPKIKNGKLFGGMNVKDYLKIAPTARKAQTVLKIRAKKGLFFTAKKYKHRSGLAAGTAVFIILLEVLSSFVWNINIVGSGDLPRAEIERKLKDFGIEEPCPTSRLGASNAKEIRNEMLNGIDSLSWAAINLDGCILDVECRLKAKTPPRPEYTPSNIIANKGGVITEIKAYGGTPCVKAGQAVVKGQLLVSGAVELTNGGTLFCHSSALIKAQVENIVETRITFRQVDKTTLAAPVRRTVLSVFGMNLPMFFGRVDGEYEVRRQVKTPEFSGVRLPISVTTASFYPINSREYEIDLQSAMKLAEETIEKNAADKFKNRIISKGKTEFKTYSDGVYALRRYLCEENIGYDEKILINE